MNNRLSSVTQQLQVQLHGIKAAASWQQGLGVVFQITTEINHSHEGYAMLEPYMVYDILVVCVMHWRYRYSTAAHSTIAAHPRFAVKHQLVGSYFAFTIRLTVIF